MCRRCAENEFDGRRANTIASKAEKSQPIDQLIKRSFSFFLGWPLVSNDAPSTMVEMNRPSRFQRPSVKT
jgi:hypothetical protein